MYKNIRHISYALAGIILTLQGCIKITNEPYTLEQRAKMDALASRPGIVNPTRTYKIDRLIIKPPQTEDWLEYQYFMQKLKLGKKIDYHHSLVAYVELVKKFKKLYVDQEEYLEDMKILLKSGHKNTAEIVEQKVKLSDRGKFCVLSHTKMRVYTPGYESSPTADKLFEEWFMYSCLHPDKKHYLYNISFSERSPTPIDTENLRTQAFSFFRGVQLVDK